MQYDITTFVREALAQGESRDAIRNALKEAGWKEEEIRGAIDTYADVAFPLPVPKPKPYLSAREAFIYLLIFLTLYISAFSFGSLLFHFINRWVPDVLHPYTSYDLNGVRMAVSSLIIAFPIYFWLSSITRKATDKDVEKRSSKIRKWLTYITLFIAAGVIIGDLITLLFNLLGGELTVRFTLKVFSVLLIAGLIFGYYLWDLRQDEKNV